ncbi:uncharacterized protein C8orf74 homolog isoform X3 [Sparus aurata]|uniref:uncharacterized protein C8orf74 homolog isoform X3 n=1 Tax=Sparus aurata TaxID=8175 RepID=UPI0011C0E541|nr:uncharacterized protein C8orf74 homolog isoform X3 [Sparus aurata]
MDSLTQREIALIARLQREAGVQRLSCHFSWPEFCDEQRRFHQEFVYDVAMFAAARGFPWPDVIRAAAMAKGIFPQLDGQSKQQCTVHAEALQGTDVREWERRRRHAELTSMLLEKEEELRVLRDGSRVTLGEVDFPEDELDEEGVLAVVRAAVRATEDQMMASLTQEASLLSDIMGLKLQQAALSTGGLHNPCRAHHTVSRTGTPSKTAQRPAKTKKKD